MINLDEYSDIGIHWIALYSLSNSVAYFESFGVEHIPEKIKIFIDKSIVVTNIFRVQANNSALCGSFCIGFIDFMLARLYQTFHQILLKRMLIYIIFLDTTKLKTVWIKITTFFKRHVSIILWSFSS